MVPFLMEETPEHMEHVAFRRGPLILARDARLETGEEPVPALCRVTVFPDGERPLTLIDCASAGRTWQEDSAFSIWMRTKTQ